jgi:competence protein ComEC
MSAAAAADQIGEASLGLSTRRPVVALSLCLAAGIALHERAPVELRWLIVIVAMLALAALCTLHRRYLSSALLAAAVVGCGVGIARVEHFQFRSNQIGLFAADEPHFGWFRLRVIDEPRILPSPVTAGRPMPPRQMAPVEVVAVRTWAGWQPASGAMTLQLDELNPQLAAAQVVEAFGRLARPQPAMNPGQFDWAAYYRQQRVLVGLTVTRAADVRVLQAPGPPPLLWLRLKVRHLLAAGFTASQSVDHALLRAMLLGDRDPQLREVQDQFRRTGIAYQLSVSGLHIGILVFAVAWLCRLACLRPGFTLGIATAVALLYAAVALPSFSGVRWAILSMAVLLATWLRREPDRPQLIALAAAVILLLHPLDLFSVGFQLSFAVVIALAVMLPPLEQMWEELRDADQAVAERVRPPSAWVRLRRWLGRWVLRSLQITLVAWLVTLPLAARDFGQASPWALLAGPLLLGPVVLCLAGGVGKILLTLGWPPLASTWAGGAALPVRFLRFAVAHLAMLPGGKMTLAAPPIWLIVVYELLLVLPLLPTDRLFNRRRRRLLWAAPVAAVGAILFLPLLPVAPGSAAPPVTSLRVTLLSLGAGQCAVIEPPGRAPAELFDAGSSTVINLTSNIVAPFLSVEGQTSLDRIFLSHGDYDHISAAGELAAGYGATSVLVSPHFRPNAVGSAADQHLLAELDRIGRTPRLVAIGDRVDLGGGAVVSVLWPPAGEVLNSNNAGLVMQLRYAGRSILFPADIQDPGFAGVLRQAQLLKSDVLVAAHHGSSESLTPAFLRAVAPQAIISSNASRLTSKQKRFDRMAGSTPLFRTSQYGAISVTIDADGTLTLDTFLKGRQLLLGAWTHTGSTQR